MQPVEISIDTEGTIRFLVNDTTAPFLTDQAVVRRASHVVPVNPALRYIFHGLRTFFGDKGYMAAFTRLWPCLWMVDLAPIDREVLPGRWRNRQAAISAEIKELNANFI